MLTGPPRRRRARPVPDAPIALLLSHSEDLAKGWLLALLERVPLDEAPRILAADLSRDGPRVCEAMLRAIADDGEEARLEQGGELAPLAGRLGELAGATGAEATSHAVDALQAVVWAALRASVPSTDPDLLTALVERLAQVTELMRAAALRRDDRGAGAPSTAPVRDPLVVGRPAADPPPAVADLRVARRSPEPEATDASHRESEPEPPPPVAGRRGPLAAWVTGDESPPEADALWVGALSDEIKRTNGAPLSLVLAELEDADKIVAVENHRGSAATFSEFAKAVRGVVRRHDILVCENDARAWIIARDTGRDGARALGSRISVAVRESQPWRGAALVATVGVAVLGEDGRSPSELIDAAEQARFAAAAEGRDIVDGE